MTPPQYPNRDALHRGLDIYRAEMSEFIARVLRQKPGQRLEQAITGSLADRQRLEFADKLRENDGNVPRAIQIGFIPTLVERNWPDLFRQQFQDSTTARNRLRVIRDIRNDLAHDTSGRDIAADKAETGLYFISEALAGINRPEPAQAVLGLRDGIRRPTPAPTATPATVPATAPSAPEPRPRGSQSHGLTPWRKAMIPKGDVAEGSFREADFAADLQQVCDGTAPAMYGDPLEFFRCTYITRGIRDLLVTAIRRVNGKGGNPVIQTKTGFGGGKTHSLIALYHLINSADELLNAPDGVQSAGVREEIAGILKDAGVDPARRAPAQVCVLQGDWLAPTSARRTPAGDPLNTLWGELAWQLGGADGYEIVGAAARQGVAPGGAELDRLFQLAGPSVILMDEIVNYARNADLDTIATFFQNLTEAVNRRRDVALIATLPVSTTEAGGARGAEAMAALENILNRTQAVAQAAQASNDEAFAVVQRRLFQEECDAAAREATCQAFYRMYQRGAGDYPPEARETRYLERLRQCYPIHPEIFDRLYDDWSLYHQFQRTRGVLRMMAQTISWLCAADDQSPMIMPGSLPFREPSISEEFIRLLGPQWSAVMGEVDGENSRTHTIDRQKPERFGSVGGAARRAARAVFLGSSTQKAVRGAAIRQVNLGVVAPGHGAAVYSEAIQAMDGELYHFYRGNDGRYYFDSEENLNKVANDRAAELDNETLDVEIIRRLSEFNQRSADRAVIAGPQSPAAVRDDDHARLVILPPDQPKSSRAAERDYAAEAARQMLSTCGSEVRRTRPNTLLFLAASSDGVREMRAAARRFKAWDSIINGDRRVSRLAGDRLNQSRDQLREADAALQNALANAYRWIMAPDQPDPRRADYETDRWRQIGGQPDLAANALQRFVADELLVDALAPEALNRRLRERVWNGPNPRYHITVDELWDLLTRNIHLGLRLRNRAVLERCLADGIRTGVFGRADGYDSDTSQYRNLRRGISESAATYLALPLAGATLIVESDMAQLQLDEIAGADPVSAGSAGGISPGVIDDPMPDDDTPTPPPAPQPRRPRRVTARKIVQSDVAMYDFNQLRDEIIRNLRNDGGAVTVEVIISGEKADGFSESITRAIRENSVQLELDFTESDYAGAP